MNANPFSDPQESLPLLVYRYVKEALGERPAARIRRRAGPDHPDLHPVRPRALLGRDRSNRKAKPRREHRSSVTDTTNLSAVGSEAEGAGIDYLEAEYEEGRAASTREVVLTAARPRRGGAGVTRVAAWFGDRLVLEGVSLAMPAPR